MKNILIIVDMQNGFTRYPQTQKLKEAIAEFLERRLFDSVIATRFLNDDHSIYEETLRWKRLKTEEDRAIDSAILKHVDYVADKYIYNCVNTSFIQRLCQLNDGEYPKKVFVIGVDTDCCVMATAVSLFENNIRPVVLTKYCQSNGGLPSHEAGLLVMKRLIGEGQLTDTDPITKDDLNKL